jgi:hypothetical protein
MMDLLLSHHCRLDALPKLIMKFEHMNQTILVSGFAKLNFWAFLFLARTPQLYASNLYTIRCSCSDNNVPIWLAPGGSQWFPRNLEVTPHHAYMMEAVDNMEANVLAFSIEATLK